MPPRKSPPRQSRRKVASPAAGASDQSHAKDQSIIAVFTGSNHGIGHCRIGKCQHQVAAADLHTARAELAHHREQAH